ncbi:Protein of unknown function [Pyronema omphalodes CBS 100304]|uniref:Uncharacterized protein n=1 Tax=Pyronema omphalodes (strain CBS 100304) TaxID=1076935 RepID=U4L4C1_PYROM|nr:Protein of unknown function [Pyronema omphalodes CBS 100304]
MIIHCRYICLLVRDPKGPLFETIADIVRGFFGLVVLLLCHLYKRSAIRDNRAVAGSTSVR